MKLCECGHSYDSHNDRPTRTASCTECECVQYREREWVMLAESASTGRLRVNEEP